MILLLLACATPEAPDPGDGITLLSPRQQLIRLSVDLRGVHPSEPELLAIEANPDLYEGYVGRYLQDPRFLDRMEEIWNQQFLTRTGDTYFDLDGFPADENVLADSVGEEPLKLVRWIIENDRPWSEIVTADHSMADPLLAAWWGMGYPEGATGWQPAMYGDSRPHAGVLSMTTLWQRYPSAGANSNRHRANQVSRILLCDDFLARPVSFGRAAVDALTTGDPEEVIRDNGVCQSCHSSLDPIAASFYGFWWETEGDRLAQSTYYPEDEELWRDYAGKAPAFAGMAVNGLPELGARLAVDARLSQCATKVVVEGLTQRTLDPVLDWSAQENYRKALVDSGEVMRELVRAVVVSREYRAASFSDDRADRIPTIKTAGPAQLAAIIEDKTGYRWSFGGRDGLTSSDAGLVVLAGGIDSVLVTVPNHEPSVSVALIQERLAQSAGWYVAGHDLDTTRSDEAVLLRYVTALDTPTNNRDAFAAQIEDLYLQITGLPLATKEGEEPAEVEELITLWQNLYSVDASVVSAWAGIVSVVLRDPLVIFY